MGFITILPLFNPLSELCDSVIGLTKVVKTCITLSFPPDGADTLWHEDVLYNAVLNPTHSIFPHHIMFIAVLPRLQQGSDSVRVFRQCCHHLESGRYVIADV